MTKQQITSRRYYLAHRAEVIARAAAWQKQNKAAATAKAKRWRAANPEKVKAMNKRWQSANYERYYAVAQAWRKANPELIDYYNWKWRRANPEKKAAIHKAWRKKNRDHYLAEKRRGHSRIVSELRPVYLAAKLAEANEPVTTENMQAKKTQIQLCRTRRLLSTLAAGSVLSAAPST